jgi:hypothetical protein
VRVHYWTHRVIPKGIPVSTNNTRMRNSIARAAVIATMTGVVALALAGPAPAAPGKILVDQDIGGDCLQDCLIYTVDFTTMARELSVAVTSPGTYGCARALVEIQLDGQNQGLRRVGPGWEQPPLVVQVGTGGEIEPGSHDIQTRFQNLADCKEGQPNGYKGHLQVVEVLEVQAPPPPVTTPMTTPKAPTATVNADVDVYNVKNEPDGAGQVVGILRAEPRPQKVELVGSCAPRSWCQVTGPNVPGGTGWVWGHLDLP